MGIVVVGSGVEEVGNRFEGSGSQGSLSVGDGPVFEALVEGSGGPTTSPWSASQWANW